MSGRQWLEAVERELYRRRLPRQDVARLVAELSDHLADAMDSRAMTGPLPARERASIESLSYFMEESMSMEASVTDCLGSPAAIAETAVREFRRRRNPLSRSWLAAFCTFALFPLPALCLAWALAILLLAALGEAGKWCGWPGERPHEVTPTLVFLGHVVMAAAVVGPAALVATFFGRLARKTSHRWQWGLIACALVALASGMVTSSASFSEQPGKSKILFGVPLGFSSGGALWTFLLEPARLGQFLFPLGTGVLILRRQSRGSAQPAGRQPLSL